MNFKTKLALFLIIVAFLFFGVFILIAKHTMLFILCVVIGIILLSYIIGRHLF